MINPVISIYTIAFNGEMYLWRCAQSVLTQSFKDLEFLIVLNGKSADNTWMIAEEIARFDSRVKLVRNLGADTSISGGRWMAFHSMAGDYFTDIDQDDCLPIDAVSKLYQLAVESHADITCGRVERIYTHQNKIIVGMHEYGELSSAEYLPIAIEYMDYLMHGKLYRLSLLRDSVLVNIDGLYDAEDILYHFQLACYAKKIVMLNDVVYLYNVNSYSSTQNLNLSKLSASFEVFVFLGRFLERNGRFSSGSDVFYKFSAFFLVRLAVVLLHGGYNFYMDNALSIGKYLNNDIIRDPYVKKYLLQYKPYYYLLRIYLVSPVLGGLASYVFNMSRVLYNGLRLAR